MSRVLAFTFVAIFSFQAFALEPGDCAAKLKTRPVPVEVRQAFERFRQLGLNQLMNDVYEAQINVSVRRPWPGLAPVSARVSWRGQKSIVVRAVNVKTPEERQKFTWQIALALYELQMNPWLWSNPAQKPTAWRDSRLELSQRLMRELYLLFMSLGKLKAQDLMAKTDPGANWIFKSLALRGASQDIAPNVADYELLKSRGLLQFENAIGDRHRRSLLFNYFMDHMKRMVVATSVVSTLSLTPYLTEIPSYWEAQQNWAQYQSELEKAPQRADALTVKTMNHLRQRELKRLKNEIELQERQQPRDESLITSLKMELQADLDRAPLGLYSPDPNSDGATE